jgi:hypothetical protein
MAVATLVSMVTFVLCTGIGGDFGDWLSRHIFRSQGKEVTRINGRAVYDSDLHKIREERNAANIYMRKASEVVKKGLMRRMDDAKKIKNDKQRQEQVTVVTAMIDDLEQALKRPRFFEGGVKFEDLIDFLLWRNEADRLNINLRPENVVAEVHRAIHWDAVVGPGVQYIYADEWYGVQRAVREAYFTFSDDMTQEALRQEFRVRLAKEALLTARPYALLYPNALRFQRKMDPRLALPPQQLWEYYSRNRTPVDIALVPVKTEAFLDKVKTPDDVQLQALFRRHQKDKYNPTSPIPGFESPPMVKVTWVTADPSSPFYRRIARAMTTLEITPPMPWTPGVPGLPQALAYAARGPAWEASLRRNYESWQLRTPERYEDAPLGAPYTALGFYSRIYEKPAPTVAAALAGCLAEPGLPALAGPALYQAAAWQSRPADYTAVLTEEAKRRVPVGARLVLAGAEITPLTAAAQAYAAYREREYLPQPVVEGQLREDIEHRYAIAWVGETMQKVRDLLDLDRGNRDGMELRLQQLLADYPGLEVHRTSRFLNQFDIADDPALRGFLDSFEKYRVQINTIEGRAGTDRQLKEGDFYRLFFTGEPFSVGNTTPYDPKIWPPVVHAQAKRPQLGLLPEQPQPVEEEQQPKTISLWEGADKPILFWKNDAKPGHMPTNLDEDKGAVRAEVTRAWKMQRAREDHALHAAKDVADALRKVQVIHGEFLPVMEQEAQRLGKKLITLDNVTPLKLLTRAETGMPAWMPYELPKGVIAYPGEDMAKDLLALSDLTAPLKLPEERQVGNKKEPDPIARRLNEINKALFDPTLAKEQADLGRPQTSQVQILTNKPQTVFYVAAVVKRYPANRFEFVSAWRDASKAVQIGDTLVDQGQEQAARQFELRFVRQLRKQAGLDENLEGIDRSGFDSSDAG